MGLMYSVEPVIICSTIILLAFSEGWNASQKAYKSLLSHKFDSGVHRPSPLYGPCPQHAIFADTNPAYTQPSLINSNSTTCTYTCMRYHAQIKRICSASFTKSSWITDKVGVHLLRVHTDEYMTAYFAIEITQHFVKLWVI